MYLNLPLLSGTIVIAGLQFGESDVFVKEGPTSRSIAIRRRDISSPFGIRVFSSTVSQYKQNHVQMGCNLTLDDLGIQESQIDPAEGNVLFLFFLRVSDCFYNYYIMNTHDQNLIFTCLKMTSNLMLMFKKCPLTLESMMINYQKKRSTLSYP